MAHLRLASGGEHQSKVISKRMGEEFREFGLRTIVAMGMELEITDNNEGKVTSNEMVTWHKVTMEVSSEGLKAFQIQI